MDRYWTKIGIGAVCVFGVGMAGITLARKGVAELKTAAFAPVEQALRSAPRLLTFRLDGQRLGRVESIEVADQNGSWTSESVRLVVALEDGRRPAHLDQCALGIDSQGRQRDAAFTCLSEAETAAGRFEQVGEVRFEPGATIRPLFASRRDVRQLERSELRGLRATVHSVGADAFEGRATYDLQDRRGRREQGTVRLDAADGRALIEIKDADGREIFRLRADEAGVSVNANNKDGARLLRLLAGERGVDIRVNP